jgi:hypothetical protein
MGKQGKHRNRVASTFKPQTEMKAVDSLYDLIQEGSEYASIVDKLTGVELFDEVIKGLKVIQHLRERPCLAYVGNVVRADNGESGVDPTDDLPFAEMIKKVPSDIKKVDIFLATRGGSGQQISRFVNCLRSRFEEVNFIIPSFCMSAGTLFALSGDSIWMTERACLGPIDPQVPTKDGRYVPAQALLLLVSELQKQGEDQLKKGGSVPWTAVRIIDTIDKKELGDALTATQYSTTMATQFLINYKFKNWTLREGSKQPVTPQYKEQRATEIAEDLASHEKWKSHGHSISREILWKEIKLKIEHPETEFEQSIIKLWALFHWIFDKTAIVKMIASENYRYCRLMQRVEKK